MQGIGLEIRITMHFRPSLDTMHWSSAVLLACQPEGNFRVRSHDVLTRRDTGDQYSAVLLYRCLPDLKDRIREGFVYVVSVLHTNFDEVWGSKAQCPIHFTDTV
uniref:hypothetical protein n=1 Tax=Paenarthrobacter ureafaciens TaxID=37931 RepID=UPI003F49664F